MGDPLRRTWTFEFQDDESLRVLKGLDGKKWTVGEFKFTRVAEKYREVQLVLTTLIVDGQKD